MKKNVMDELGVKAQKYAKWRGFALFSPRKILPLRAGPTR